MTDADVVAGAPSSLLFPIMSRLHPRNHRNHRNHPHLSSLCSHVTFSATENERLGLRQKGDRGQMGFMQKCDAALLFLAATRRDKRVSGTITRALTSWTTPRSAAAAAAATAP
jgi:hypothetical protein